MRAALLLPLACALPAFAAGPVIDDARLLRTMQAELAKLADAGGPPAGKELAEMLGKAPPRAAVDLPPCLLRPGYESAVQSVVLLGSVGHCAKGEACKRWHLGGTATAWCVGAGGLFVTNHHCFAKAEGKVHGICTLDGRVAPVTEVLAGDKAADTCLFRVAGDGFTPLPPGQPAAVGDPVRVISHPERFFFVQTTGEVARYYRRPGRNPATWMMITADFARGSSGGPVLDRSGAVVGMVSSTHSIYYGDRTDKEEQGPLQMVVKSCVPAEALLRLLGRR